MDFRQRFVLVEGIKEGFVEEVAFDLGLERCKRFGHKGLGIVEVVEQKH